MREFSTSISIKNSHHEKQTQHSPIGRKWHLLKCSITNEADNFSHIHRLFKFPLWSPRPFYGSITGLPSHSPACPLPSRHTQKSFPSLTPWAASEGVPGGPCSTCRCSKTPEAHSHSVGSISRCPLAGWYPARPTPLTSNPQSSGIEFYNRMKGQASGTPCFGISILYRKGWAVGGGAQLFFFPLGVRAKEVRSNDNRRGAS